MHIQDYLTIVYLFSKKVNYSYLGNICNLWRNYDDIEDSWASVKSILDWYSTNQDDLQPAAGPGHWNDPDMVGGSVAFYTSCFSLAEL